MVNRRQFLATVSFGIAGLKFGAGCAAAREGSVPLAFSTLGTPEWSWPRILAFAIENSFSGLEIRTLEGSEDLPSRPEFAAGRIGETRRQLEAAGLEVICLGSSASMHDADEARRSAQIEHGKQFIVLASDLGAPYVRVFGDRYPEGEEREVVLERVATGLRELGAYAGDRGVMVLLETHGDFTDSPSVLEIIDRTDSAHVAVLWDAHHTFVSAGEDADHSVRELGDLIRHVHLKDSVATPEGRQYVLTGQGDVPVLDQVDALRRGGYRGYYSLEWEKRWHPDIEEPEVALPHFAELVRGHLAGG